MEKLNKDLIAPCGINCGICRYYLRAENKCPGCFTGRKINNRPIKCGIRLCEKRQGKYCFECEDFPCERLKRLDKRYRERYGMSEIENLEYIRDHGMGAFIDSEREKWQSDRGILCVHDKKYY